MSEPNLMDDGSAQFEIALDGDQLSYEDLMSADAPDDYSIKHVGCGSTNCQIRDTRGHGSSWTGGWGSLEIECIDCGATRVLIDYG